MKPGWQHREAIMALGDAFEELFAAARNLVEAGYGAEARECTDLAGEVFKLREKLLKKPIISAKRES